MSFFYQYDNDDDVLSKEFSYLPTRQIHTELRELSPIKRQYGHVRTYNRIQENLIDTETSTNASSDSVSDDATATLPHNEPFRTIRAYYVIVRDEYLLWVWEHERVKTIGVIALATVLMIRWLLWIATYFYS